MEILVTIKNCLPYIGITTFNHPHGQLVGRILRMAGLFVLSYIIATTMWYLVFDAPSFAEQTKALASVDMVVYMQMVYLIYIWRWHSYEDVLEMIQHQIAKRA